jgi:hypothetical protein
MRAFIAWLVQAIIGLVLMGFTFVALMDYTAGCGQTYIDAKGAVRPVAKNSECILIKHHER